VYCNMSEALELWRQATKPDVGGEYSIHDAFVVKLDDDAYKLASDVRRIFKNRAQCWGSGVIVFGKGAKCTARYYLNERYLNGDVDVRFEPERKGNGYYIQMC